MAMADELKNNNIFAIAGVVNSLLPYAQTNLDLGELMTLAYVGLQMDMTTLDQLRLPADGTFESGTFDGVWCIKPDFEKNSKLLYSFIYDPKPVEESEAESVGE